MDNQILKSPEITRSPEFPGFLAVLVSHRLAELFFFSETKGAHIRKHALNSLKKQLLVGSQLLFYWFNHGLTQFFGLILPSGNPTWQ